VIAVNVVTRIPLGILMSVQFLLMVGVAIVSIFAYLGIGLPIIAVLSLLKIKSFDEMTSLFFVYSYGALTFTIAMPLSLAWLPLGFVVVLPLVVFECIWPSGGGVVETAKRLLFYPALSFLTLLEALGLTGDDD